MTAIADTLGHETAVVRRVRPLYERTLGLLARGRGIPWNINGAHFRISPFQRHRMGALYDAAVAEFLSRHIRPGATCFDVGANVGVYALQFAHWTGPSGRVVAFEPNPVAARILTEHVRMNDLTGRVEIVQAAVAERAGTQTFHMADADGMSRLAAPNPRIAGMTRCTDVPVMTIDEFCEQRGVVPEWLLVDVEGFEFAVLAGAKRTLARQHRRLRLVVEMHPDAWGVAGWSRESGEALLDELRLSATSLLGHTDPLASYGHVLLSPKGETSSRSI